MQIRYIIFVSSYVISYVSSDISRCVNRDASYVIYIINDVDFALSGIKWH